MANIPITPSSPNAMDISAPSGIGQARFDQTNLPIAATTGLPPANTVQSIPTGTERNSPIGPAVFKWDKYQFMLNAYFSTGGFYDGTALVKSVIEKDDQWLERRSTCYYRNFVRPIIDATYTPVFSICAVRNIKINDVIDKTGESVPVWNAFIKNVDSKGHDIQLFIEKIVKYSRILGVSFVVMDNHPGDQIPEKTEDQIKDRKFPFVYMRLPQQVEPELLQVDEFGNITQIAFREKPEIVIDPLTKQKKEESRWKLWTKNYSAFYRKNDKHEFEMIPGSEIVYNFNQVPVLAVYSSEIEDDTFLPHPTYYDIARCNWALFNIDSAQMRLIRSQMFAMLCMPKVEGSLAASPLNGVELPTSTPEATYPLPFYLAPPTGPYAELGNTVNAIKEDLYRLANQHGVAGTQGVSKAASGISKAYDFQANNWVLKKSAQMAKATEEKIAELYQLYVPSEKFNYTAEYEDNYEPDSVDDNIKSTSEYLALDAGVKARTAALKQATACFFRGIDEDELQVILDDIEQSETDKAALPTEEELATEVQANANDDAMRFLQDSGKVPSQRLAFKKKEIIAA